MKKLIFLLLFLLGCSSLVRATATGPVTKIDSTLIKKHQDSIADAKKKADAALQLTKKKIDSQKLADQKKVDEADTGIALRPIIGWIIIIGIIALFFVIACRTTLLRDTVMDPVAFMKLASVIPKYKGKTIDEIKKPFSLARSQLGVWTVVIGCSYIYLELCRCYPTQINGVDKTLLGLMGISAGTTAAGSVIDNSATSQQQASVSPSEGFSKDILSDKDGINIHRFQNVIWTLIAVTLYLSQIPDVICGNLPQLDSTLVSLTAISSATYLGLKINENKTPA